MFKKLEKFAVIFILMGMFLNMGLMVSAEAAEAVETSGKTELTQLSPLDSEKIPKSVEEVKEKTPEIIEENKVKFAEEELLIPNVKTRMMVSQDNNVGDDKVIYEDSILVNKSVEKCTICRTYEVTLDITGTPPDKPVDVVIVIDRSGSMSGQKLIDAKGAAVIFADNVLGGGNPKGNRIAVVSYAYSATTDLPWNGSFDVVEAAINGLSAGSTTNIQDGFIKAETQIDAARAGANKAIVLLSDGQANQRVSDPTRPYPANHDKDTAAAYQKGQDLQAKARVFTIGLDVGSYIEAVETLQWAAQAGNYHDTYYSADLADIYRGISSQLNYSALDAVVKDKIGDNFELIIDSLPAGVMYDPITREITWSPGTIILSAQLKYKVVAKDSFLAGAAFTNEYAYLNYVDVNGDTVIEKPFPKPEVIVYAKLDVSLTDATVVIGDSIALGTGMDPLGENYMDITGGDGTGARTYEWREVGNTTVISTDANPTVSPVVDTEYEVTVIGPNGCIALATMMVTVTEPKVDVTVTKIWEGGPKVKPTIELQLLRDGVKHGVTVELLSGTETYTWIGLDQTDGKGKNYVYTVMEVKVPDNYDMTISEDGLTITNTYHAVKGAQVPVTGINNNQFLFVVTLILSSTGLFGLSKKRKKER